MNEYHKNWLDLIYQRDQFYLYMVLGGIAAFLVYRWLRLWRYIKIVLAAAIILSLVGVLWGAIQLGYIS